MGFNHSALIGFGGAGVSSIPDSAFPQVRVANTSFTTTSTQSNVAVPYPSGIQANDIIFGFGRFTDTNGLTGGTAAGMTEVARQNANNIMFWKRAVGGESGTVQFTIAGGGGGTQTVAACMWAVSNCITSGTPFAGADTSNGGGTPVSTTAANPFDTTVANSGGMHAAYLNSASATFQGWDNMPFIGFETSIGTSTHLLSIGTFRCPIIGTQLSGVTGFNDAVTGSKCFFSMELFR